MNDSDDYLGRAMAAWFRSEGSGTAQPSNDSGVRSVDGMDYVVLENGNGILAVYRIKPDGFLKRLKRWPSELETPVLATTSPKRRK